MIFKNRSKNNFTQIDNFVIQKESDISWRALGLLTYLVSLPPDWSITIEKLGKVRVEGRDAVRTAMNELVTAGYVVRRGRKKLEDGKLAEFLYDVSDIKWLFHNDDHTSVTGNPPGSELESDSLAQEEDIRIGTTADEEVENDETSPAENFQPFSGSSVNTTFQKAGLSVDTENPSLDSHNLDNGPNTEPVNDNPVGGEPAQDNPNSFKEEEESKKKRKNI